MFLRTIEKQPDIVPNDIFIFSVFFQDGRRQTGSTYISACRPDSNEIPTATPMFLGSGNTVLVFFNPIRCNRKSEIQHGGRQTGSTYISACRNFNGYPMFSGSGNMMLLLWMLSTVAGSHKSSILVAKQEEPTSQLVYQMPMKFQQLLPCFWAQAFVSCYCEDCKMLPEVGIQQWQNHCMINTSTNTIPYSLGQKLEEVQCVQLICIRCLYM